MVLGKGYFAIQKLGLLVGFSYYFRFILRAFRSEQTKAGKTENLADSCTIMPNLIQVLIDPELFESLLI